MPTKTIRHTDGTQTEVELTQEEIDAMNAMNAAHEAFVQQEQVKRDAYKAKKAEVQQLEDTALAIQISDAELAALAPVLQKIYRILHWLREKRALEMMDRGSLPFDITEE